MIRRRPTEHNAQVTIEKGGRVEHGEWVEGSKEILEVHGRFDQSNSSRRIQKLNRNGDILDVFGEYYTDIRKPKDGDPITISIPGIGVEQNIIVWEDYQTHSVIYVG